jgi:branched-chain amino acid transport system substrate-binding protein
MHMIRRIIPTVITVALAGLGLAACGGSSAGGSSSASGPTQGIQGKTILVGSSAILSGPESPYAEIAQGFNSYLNYVNSQGGVDGYKFKVIQQDNAYQAAQAVAVARTLVLQKKVFVLAGSGTTPTQATIPFMATQKVPFVFVANADLAKKTLPNIYGEEPSFTRESLFDARYALKTLKTTKLAYAYEDDDIGQPPLSALPKYVSQNGGTLETKVGFPATATSYSSYASQLQASKAQTVIVFAGPTNVAALQKAAAAIGYHPKWIALFASVTPAYVQLAGSSAAGTYFDNFFETTDSNTPSVNLFKQQVTKTNADLVGLLGELGWTQGALIADGVKGALAKGKLTYSSFENALNQLTGKQVGVWPDVTFTAQSHSGAESADMLQVQSGKFVPVTKFLALPQLP